MQRAAGRGLLPLGLLAESMSVSNGGKKDRDRVAVFTLPVELEPRKAVKREADLDGQGSWQSRYLEVEPPLNSANLSYRIPQETYNSKGHALLV